jgi:hypothetical protein
MNLELQFRASFHADSGEQGRQLKEFHFSNDLHLGPPSATHFDKVVIGNHIVVTTIFQSRRFLDIKFFLCWSYLFTLIVLVQ